MPDPTPDAPSSTVLLELDERVSAFLTRMDLDVDRSDDGLLLFRHGSTVVMISTYARDGHVWVRMVATLLADVTPSMALLGRLLRLNTEVLLGAFLLFDDNTLAFAHTLLADRLDFEAFEYAVTYVSRVGDDYDEELQSVAGGVRAEDILRDGA